MSTTTPSRFSPGFQTGTVPGRAVYTGEARSFQPSMHVFEWTADELNERDGATLDDAVAVRDLERTCWIDVVGVHEVEYVREIGSAFGLHPLSIEDMVNPRQRPKVEFYDGYTYVVLKMARTADDGTILLEQVSLVIGKDFVLTLQEEPGDVFENVRVRLRNAVGRVRGRSHDYFAYALMDAIVDGYVDAVTQIGEHVEGAEELLDEGDGTNLADLPARLHDHKRELMTLRKVLVPLRDAIGILLRNEEGRIADNTVPYFRDLHDHTVQVVDAVEMYREMISNLVNLHLAVVSQRTNEEMRVLTVIATIFIPLTFIVGVYGMNFEAMPELAMPWAYPVLWIVMVGVAAGLLYYFRRRGML